MLPPPGGDVEPVDAGASGTMPVCTASNWLDKTAPPDVAPGGVPATTVFRRLAEEPCGRPSRFESGTVGPPLRLWRRQQQFGAARFLRDTREENLLSCLPAIFRFLSYIVRVQVK